MVKFREALYSLTVALEMLFDSMSTYCCDLGGYFMAVYVYQRIYANLKILHHHRQFSKIVTLLFNMK